MEQKKSIKKNLMMSLILTSSSFLFPLVSYSYVARILTPEGTGKVAFVQSVIQYFLYVATLGVPTYGTREVAKCRDDKEKLSQLVTELFAINSISTGISLLALTISVFLVNKFSNYKVIFLVFSLNIIFNLIGFEWLYQGLEEYSYITKRTLLFRVAALILTFVIVKNENNCPQYAFLVVLTNTGSYIWNFVGLRKYISFKRKISYSSLKKHIKPIFTLFSASIIMSIYANFDVIMLGFIKTDTEVGLYNSALKIKNILLSLSSAVTAALIPRIAYYFQNNAREKIDSLLKRSLRVSFLLAIPATVYIFVKTTDVILFLFGCDYIESKNTLYILLLCIFPLVMTNLFGNQVLIPFGMEKRFTQSVFMGMWINIILNALLIPFWGSFGAAIGTLIAESWNFYWMSSAVPSIRKEIFHSMAWGKYFIALALSSIITLIIDRLICYESVLIIIFLTGGTFFFVYYVTLIIFKDEDLIDIINTVLNKMHFKGNMKL